MKLRNALLFLSLLTVSASGQVTTGSISGFVLDPSGRPIRGATVTARDAGRAAERSALTDPSGYYRISDLPPAQYDLTAAATDFAATEPARIDLAVGSTLRADFHPAIAGSRQTVEVTTSLSAIPSETSELGAVLDRSRVSGLPLNRRDFLQLSLLTPGIAPPVEDSELSTRGAFAMHANGGREEFNNFLLDGVDNNDQGPNRYVLQPSVDAIQEFRIAASTYNAEYGRAAGGQVNVVTRSGANEWHGFVYEYLRNRRLDARNYFDTAETAKYIRNQFGGGLGGPARRDRAFFFVSAESLRERRGFSRLGTVPSAAQRQGDLSSTTSPVLDPFTRQPFPGNRVPQSRIHPLASRVLALYPQPNLPGVAGNLLGQPVGRDGQDQVHSRYDHWLTGRDLLTLRYSWGDKALYEPYAEESTDIPGYGDFVEDDGHNAMVHYQRTLSAGAVNSLRLGFNRATRRLRPENSDTDVNALWGVNWLPTQPSDFGFPAITVAGFSRTGDVTQLPIHRPTTTYQLTEAVSLVRGAHSWKLGAEIRRIHQNGIVNLLSRGSLTFSGALSGNGLADLLLGLPSFGLQSKPDNPQTLRSTAWNFYAQDDWKIRPNLTLNLGVRYEYNTPYVDPFNRMAALDLATGRLSQVGSNGITRSGYRPDRDNFAPRIGFAWTPIARTVVRGGYGMYFDSGLALVNSSLYFNPPYFSLRVFFPTATSLLTLSNPFPSQGGITPPASLSTINPDLTTAYLQHWNLNVQREIPTLGTVSAAYAGSSGTHLIRSRDINQPRPAPGDVQSRRPNRAYANILLIESGANSNYHSMQLSWNRPMARRVSLFSAYTWSKSIDDTSAFLSTKADKNFPQDSSSFGPERSLSSFDLRHRFTLAAIYALPTRNLLLRNIEVSSIVAAHSGRPLSPILRFDNSNTGNTGGTFGSDRPHLLGDPVLSNPSPARWFDTAAFAVPARFTFGSAGRNVLRGPGFAAVDLSASRNFALTEQLRLSAQVQVFNALNRANFDNPERFADEPTTFGRIFSAKPPRQIQFALRLAF